MKNRSRNGVRVIVFCRRLSHHRSALFGLCFLVLILLMTIFAKLVVPYSPSKLNLSDTFQLPSVVHWFGTDEFGRDIFSRVVFGARISLLVGFVAVSIALLLGGGLGLLAGYCGGWFDGVIMRVMDMLFAIPQLLLAISVAATLGPGVGNLMLAVGITTLPRYARLTRASVMSVKEMEYVEAAIVSGSSHFFIIRRHVLPNCMAPLIVQSTIGVAFAILIASSLSFIGLGLQPPSPEWGAMLAMGRNYIRDYPHLTIFPGLAIMLTILSLNLFGDGLRDILDPKLAQSR